MTKIIIGILIGFILGFMFVVHNVERAKEKFWRCEPEIHGYSYCFIENFGSLR